MMKSENTNIAKSLHKVLELLAVIVRVSDTEEDLADDVSDDYLNNINDGLH